MSGRFGDIANTPDSLDELSLSDDPKENAYQKLMGSADFKTNVSKEMSNDLKQLYAAIGSEDPEAKYERPYNLGLNKRQWASVRFIRKATGLSQAKILHRCIMTNENLDSVVEWAKRIAETN